MYKIHLHNLAFRAPVGVFEEEKKLGTDILINLVVKAKQLPHSSDHYLDYGQLFDLIRQEVQHPTDLLEEMGSRIIHALFALNETIIEAEMKIKKMHPPIPGCRGSVEIELVQTRP